MTQQKTSGCIARLFVLMRDYEFEVNLSIICDNLSWPLDLLTFDFKDLRERFCLRLNLKNDSNIKCVFEVYKLRFTSSSLYKRKYSAFNFLFLNN